MLPLCEIFKQSRT